MPNPIDDLLDNSPEWAEWAQHVQEDLIPMLDQSAITMSLVSKGAHADVKFAVELGLSIMMNKPIMALVLPGVEVPPKLRLVADVIVEPESMDDASMSAAISDGMARMMELATAREESA